MLSATLGACGALATFSISTYSEEENEELRTACLFGSTPWLPQESAPVTCYLGLLRSAPSVQLQPLGDVNLGSSRLEHLQSGAQPSKMTVLAVYTWTARVSSHGSVQRAPGATRQ